MDRRAGADDFQVDRGDLNGARDRIARACCERLYIVRRVAAAVGLRFASVSTRRKYWQQRRNSPFKT